MTQDNVELVRRAYEAFNAGDPSVWLGLYDPDIVLVVAPNGFRNRERMSEPRQWSGGTRISSARSAAA